MALNKSFFNCFDKDRNMWQRMVGDSQHMGLFDYLLIIPFFLKLGIKPATDKNNYVSALTLASLQLPFSAVKLALYVALSPVIFLSWVISKIASGHKIRHQVTGDQVDLNQLMVNAPSDPPGTDAQKMSKVHKLYDFQAYKYDLKIDRDENLVFVFPYELSKRSYTIVKKDVAVVAKTKENIDILQGMLDAHKIPFVSHIVGVNLSSLASAKTIEKWIDRTEQHLALNHIKLEQAMLVDKVQKAQDGPKNFADLPRDVRRMIFQERIAQEVAEPKGANDRSVRFFNTLEQHNRQAALLQFRSDTANKWVLPTSSNTGQ